MDDDTRAAISTLAGQALVDRLLLTVLMADVLRRSGDPVGAAAWIGEAAAFVAKDVDPTITRDLRQVVAQAMDIAEARRPDGAGR